MHKVVINPDIDPLEENRHQAEANRARLREHGAMAVDILGSIGSGKTALVALLGERLRARGKGVVAIVGDVAGDDDCRRLVEAGIPTANVNTGKECHLDAHYVEHALDELDLEGADVVFIENVGNLVCPADFALGAEKRIVVISITEGDDMVRKHPMIFAETDAAVLNKIDLAPFMDASVDRILSDYSKVNPHGRIFVTSARRGDGLDDLTDFILDE
ncbi:MAG: hydrogenase nickel incorporation protein HypB [Thermoplasmata archaeon]|nr:hydrogenase nickel incorporation protein HypB [Thermoplasmata archaeon]